MLSSSKTIGSFAAPSSPGSSGGPGRVAGARPARGRREAPDRVVGARPAQGRRGPSDSLGPALPPGRVWVAAFTRLACAPGRRGSAGARRHGRDRRRAAAGGPASPRPQPSLSPGGWVGSGRRGRGIRGRVPSSRPVNTWRSSRLIPPPAPDALSARARAEIRAIAAAACTLGSRVPGFRVAG